MAKKINWIKARVIDTKHPKFGQVVDCCRVPDTRFFGNRYQIKNARHLVFGDQLTLLKDGEIDKPIPVMYSAYGNSRGPWSLGWIHPDDYKTVYNNFIAHKLCNITSKSTAHIESLVNVMHQFDGIPCYPQLIVPLENFTAPDWAPDWRYDVYCEGRKEQ